MSDKEDTSLVPRPSGELVRIPPGASAIIDGMVDDATAIIRTRDTDQQEKSLAQSGIRLDPELVQAGGRMAHLCVKSGIHRFVDFAKHMAAEFGAKVNPISSRCTNGCEIRPAPTRLWLRRWTVPMRSNGWLSRRR